MSSKKKVYWLLCILEWKWKMYVILKYICTYVTSRLMIPKGVGYVLNKACFKHWSFSLLPVYIVLPLSDMLFAQKKIKTKQLERIIQNQKLYGVSNLVKTLQTVLNYPTHSTLINLDPRFFGCRTCQNNLCGESLDRHILIGGLLQTICASLWRLGGGFRAPKRLQRGCNYVWPHANSGKPI